jgi:hypothetical protein
MNRVERLIARAGGEAPRPQFFRVRLLFAQMAAIVPATLAMYLLPLPFGCALLTLLYALIVALELRHGVHSPISLTLLAVNAALFLFGERLAAAGYEALVPALLFGALLAVSGTLFLANRPATSFYGVKAGFMDLHRRTSACWLAVYAAATLGALAAARDPGLFWLVPAAVTAGVAATLWLQVVDMGRAWRAPDDFELGNYRFVRLANSRDSLLPFYRHFLREALPSLRAGTPPQGESQDALLNRAVQLYESGWSTASFFAAYHGDEVVGTIYCRSDRSGPLSFEAAYPPPFGFGRLRRYGSIVDVNFFSISKQHRFGHDLIQGLLRCALEYAMEHDAAFLITQAYQSALPVYQKIGFFPLAAESVQTRLGASARLIGFNLARRSICENGALDITGKLEGILTPYVAERYFKRQTLKSMLTRRQAWRLWDEDMQALVAGTRAD